MRALLYKELRLAAMPLSYVFIAAALLTFVPGYPILMGAFFTTLGLFYSFQTMRENNDVAFTMMLPVSKRDAVRGKFAFVLLVELCSFVLMTAVTLIRMTVLRGAAVYAANALMGANLVFTGWALLLFGLFNRVFVAGFFKTAYFYGRPFIAYCAVALLCIIAAEALWHIPGLEALNAFGFEHIALQLVALAAGAIAFALLTCVAIRRSEKRFEAIDL